MRVAQEVLDNLCNSSRECLRRVESIVGRRIEFHLVDLCNAAAVELLFQRRHFDAVVHFAGLKVSRSCAARRGTTSGPTHVGSS